MKIFKTKYRVVRDQYSGYEAQYRYWWMPMFLQIDTCNTNPSLEMAIDLCKKHNLKNKIVWRLDSDKL